ncbi:hypothetical protein TCAL_17280 [Tigriopus californicus]|uniref:Uncharacterized protein n=1 Tax=Tigriopus californicus TaxID=6832 RepID=A0A553NYW5_TIGCA|nr:hypothetical protein TCAL_17280 [Tigriopus californicus]
MEPLVITEAGDHRFKHQEESLFSPDTNEFLHLERTLQIREHSDKFPGDGPGFKDGSDGESLDRLSGNTSLSGDNMSCGRMSSNSSLNGDISSSSGRVSFRRVELSYEESAEEVELAKKQFQSELEFKLEERKKSIDAGGDGETALQLMERRQLRQFSRADEYLYAMKEDLSEWFNMLYPGIDIDADNFMDRLETGEHLIRAKKPYHET